MNNELIFKSDFAAAVTAQEPIAFKSGIFEVKVVDFKVEINDGKKALTIFFERLDNGESIIAYRHFIDQFPYGKPELSYDAVHDMLGICGIENTGDMMLDKDFNTDVFYSVCEQAIGTELIILVHNQWGMHENVAEARTRLRFATYMDGISYEEKKVNDTSREDLVRYGTRLCATTTEIFREYFGEEVNDKPDLDLLYNKFGEYVDRVKSAREAYLNAIAQ